MMSVIIPIMGKRPDRVPLFAETLQCIQQQDFRDYELIVVEQYSDEPMWEEDVATFSPRYIAIQGSPLCVPWCKNVGAREARSNVLVFLDADVVFGTDYFRVIMENFTSARKYSAGWDSTLWLHQTGLQEYLSTHTYTPNWSSELLQQELFIGLDGPANFGLSIVFDKEFFRSIGGYNENFDMWSADDKDLLTRAIAATGDDCKLHTIPYTVLHLWHGTREKSPTWKEDREYRLSCVSKYPLEVSRRLVEAQTGNPEHRSLIDWPDMR